MRRLILLFGSLLVLFGCATKGPVPCEGPIQRLNLDMRGPESPTSHTVHVPQHTSADPQSGVVQGAAQSAVPIPAPPAAQPLEAKTKGGKVKVFFANTIKGKLGSCQDVFSVTRSVPQTPRVATAAISELIKGPTPEEAKAGFVSVVGRDTKLKSVEIKDGDAYVDFSALVFSGTVDKCSVVTMKSQIDSTLRQFVSIRFVRIMIDGKPWEEPVR